MTRLPVAPSRQLGQHFLVDENILGVIGRLAELAPDDVVLEVGPGLGVLTTMAVLAAVTALTTMAILTALPGIRAARERRFLCRPAEAPDQLAGQVLQPGEVGRPAVEPFRPAGQPEQVIEYLAQLRHGD